MTAIDCVKICYGRRRLRDFRRRRLSFRGWRRPKLHAAGYLREVEAFTAPSTPAWDPKGEGVLCLVLAAGLFPINGRVCFSYVLVVSIDVSGLSSHRCKRVLYEVRW